ncbi:DUF2237-containing protein [Aureococcus anophagefferens]|nr:DUF2237-containing protein [Aureococcus anophagefferens]
MRAVLLLAQITATTAYKNVLGKELEHCSGAGMALTGYTREGQCVDRYDDAGSHHICINMKSTSNGNFCDVTGQPNWFASYLSRAGGCDKIQEIVCEATNMEAYIAYTKSAQHAEAACLERRGISAAISDDEAATATAGFSVPAYRAWALRSSTSTASSAPEISSWSSGSAAQQRQVDDVA